MSLVINLSMKKYFGLIGSIGLLVSVAPAWAEAPEVVLENFKDCPAQEAPLRSALKLDPELVNILPRSANGKITIHLSGPSDDPYVDMDSPLGEVSTPITDGEMRSSPFGGGSWNLNPTTGDDGKCVPVSAAEIADSVHFWKKNLFEIPAPAPKAAKNDKVGLIITSPPGASIQGPFPGPKLLDDQEASNGMRPVQINHTGAMQNATKN
jgi:hypothetical protein